MKKHHQMKMLEEVCELNMGQSPESSSYNQDGNGLPFYQGNADFSDLHPITRCWCNKPTKVAKPQDLLISVRAPIGAMNIATEICCIGRGLAALTPKKDIAFGKYVYYVLRGKHSELNAKGTGSTFKAITKTVLSETLIPLPPLAEQERIAAVLDQASELIALRHRQIEKLDLLVKAKFVEMFGDPVTNPMGWDVKKLKDIVDEFRYGTSTKSSYDIKGYPILRIPNILGSNINLFDLQYNDTQASEYDRIKLIENDLLFVRSNGNPEYTGRCALVDKSCEGFVFASYLIRARVTSKQIVHKFLLFLLKTCALRHQLMSISKTTAGQYNINTVGLGSLKIFLPSLSLQKDFAAFVEQVEKQKALMQQGLEKLELNYKALMQRFFN
jgi:type I restriction enzyme S subunit